MSYNYLVDWDKFDKEVLINQYKYEYQNQILDKLQSQNQNQNVTQNQNINKPLIKKYYQAPPIINSTLVYQNVNNDKKLRENVTIYFLNKCIKWLTKNKDFNQAKKNINKIKSEKGIIIIYNLIRKYVKANNYNWYDLRTYHYNSIKDYFNYKLTKI
jgi:hypothetical protein